LCLRRCLFGKGAARLQFGLQAFQFRAQCRRLVDRLTWRNERPRLELPISAHRLMEPDGQRARLVQHRQRRSVLVGEVVNRIVPGDANVVEQVQYLRGQRPTILEAAQSVGLALLRAFHQAEARGDYCRQQLAEHPQLDEAPIRILGEVALG
jgi:hypothetical protein